MVVFLAPSVTLFHWESYSNFQLGHSPLPCTYMITKILLSFTQVVQICLPSILFYAYPIENLSRTTSLFFFKQKYFTFFYLLNDT